MIINLPNGKTWTPPEGMTQAEIETVLAQQFPPQAPGDSALNRFSQGAIASGASFADLLTPAARLAGIPHAGSTSNLQSATNAGITSPEALRRPDLASVAGRGAPFLLGGLAARPAAAAAEGLAYLGGTGGEMLGREAGGELGAAFGGITGSLGAGLAHPALRSALTSSGGLADNASLSAAAGAQLGLGEQGGSYLARWIDSTSQKIPGGHHMARARATRIALQISNRAATLGRNLAGGAITPESGGRAIRQGWDAFIERFRETGARYYDELGAAVRSADVHPQNYARLLGQLGQETAGQTQTARGLAQPTAGFVEDMAARFAADIQRNPRMTMEQLNGIRSRLGLELNDAAQFGTPRQAIVKRMYGAVTEDQRILAILADQQARQANARPTALRAWQKANNYWRAGRERIDRVSNAVMQAGTDSKLFKAVFSSATTGPETIRAIKRSIPQEQWDVALGITLNRMGLETPGASTVTNLAEAGEQGWNLNRFLSNWIKMDQAGSTKALLDGASNAALRSDLSQLARVASGSRELLKTAANPSGTAPGLIAAGGGVSAAGAIALGFLPETLKVLAAGAAFSAGGQFITSNPRFIHWLAASTKVPVAQLPQHMQRLMEVVKKEPESVELAKGVVAQWAQTQK